MAAATAAAKYAGAFLICLMIASPAAPLSVLHAVAGAQQQLPGQRRRQLGRCHQPWRSWSCADLASSLGAAVTATIGVHVGYYA